MNSFKEVESVLENIVEKLCVSKNIIEEDEYLKNESESMKNIFPSHDFFWHKSLETENDFSSTSERNFSKRNFSTNLGVASDFIFIKETSNVTSDLIHEKITNLKSISDDEKQEHKNSSDINFATKEEVDANKEFLANNFEELLSREIDKAFEKYEALFDKKDKHMKSVSVQTVFCSGSVSSPQCVCELKNSKPETEQPNFFGTIISLKKGKDLHENLQTTGESSTVNNGEEEEANFIWKVPAKRIRLGLSKHIRPKSLYNKIF